MSDGVSHFRIGGRGGAPPKIISITSQKSQHARSCASMRAYAHMHARLFTPVCTHPPKIEGGYKGGFPPK